MRLLNVFIFFNVIALFGSGNYSLLPRELYLCISSIILDDNPATCAWLYHYFNNSQDSNEKVDFGFDRLLMEKFKETSDFDQKYIFHQNGALVNLKRKTIAFPVICNFSMTCKTFYNFFKEYRKKFEYLWFSKRSFLLLDRDELRFQDIFFDSSIPTLSLDQINKGLKDNYFKTKQQYSVVSNLIQSICATQRILDNERFDINDIKTKDYIYLNILVFYYLVWILELKKIVDLKN